jgi:hypothetical protein
MDKRLLKETVTVAADKQLPRRQCEEIVRASPRRALEEVAAA